MKAISVPSGSSSISATRLKKGDVYQQAIKSGAKGLPFLKVLASGKYLKILLSATYLALHPSP